MLYQFGIESRFRIREFCSVFTNDESVCVAWYRPLFWRLPGTQHVSTPPKPAGWFGRWCNFWSNAFIVPISTVYINISPATSYSTPYTLKLESNRRCPTTHNVDGRWPLLEMKRELSRCCIYNKASRTIFFYQLFNTSFFFFFFFFFFLNQPTDRLQCWHRKGQTQKKSAGPGICFFRNTWRGWMVESWISPIVPHEDVVQLLEYAKIASSLASRVGEG